MQKAITPRTKAVIPVRLYGRLAEMPKIMAIAQDNDLLVLLFLGYQDLQDFFKTIRVNLRPIKIRTRILHPPITPITPSLTPTLF